jgi:putative spermidine/putrescine transport system permease protein
MSSSRPDAAGGVAALLDAAAPPAPGTAMAPPRPGATGAGMPPYLQAAPLALVLLLFLVLPLLVTAAVSLWDYTEFTLVPDVTLRNYREMFEGCASGGACATFRTYLSTFRLCALTLAATLPLGFAVAYFLAFHVRSDGMRTALFLLCTAPFLTSNVIRMISWIPLLGREGAVNRALLGLGAVERPLDWLLYSEFAVVLAFVHLYTLFVVVPVFNSLMRIDRRLLEAARDAGASGRQVLSHVVLPLAKPGLAIGAIFVGTLVMGDFVTVGVMGGQQIASVGKAIQTHAAYLQFPAAAAQSVVLLGVVLLMIAALTRLVDVRREL